MDIIKEVVTSSWFVIPIGGIIGLAAIIGIISDIQGRLKKK